MATERKADFIANDLLGRIVSGELPVGSLLPKEPELAQHYGANRSVVREAVKQLEVHRLVEPVRRRGTLVLDPLASLTPEVLRAMLVPGGRRVDARVLESLLELRAQLDEQMNTLAALRRTDEDLRTIEAAVRRIDAARGSSSRFAEGFETLAMALARATHNQIFEMLVNWQRHIFRDLEGFFLLVRQPSENHVQGLYALLDAVRRQDALLARDLARAFHAYATPILLDAIRSGPEPTQRAAPAMGPVPARALPTQRALNEKPAKSIKQVLSTQEGKPLKAARRPNAAIR